MEIYSKIKKELAEKAKEKGKPELVKVVPKILDLYFYYIIKAIGYTGKFNVTKRKIKFYLVTRPIAYATREMYKNMLISSLNSNYVFEIKIRWDDLKKNKFTFKTMKKFKYLFKKYTLDNDNVYKIIQNYEKSIL